MADYPAIRDPNRCPTHPGLVLDDILPDLGKPKAEIACLLGISRQMLYKVTAGRARVSPTLAAKLGKLFGDGPGIWLRMQAGYDAWHAEREVDVSNIPTIRAA
jgi:addiction module HigA family antidote